MSRTVTTRTTNPAELHRQNVYRTNRLIRPVLHLQDHGATLQSPQRMPLTSGDVQRTCHRHVIARSVSDVTISQYKRLDQHSRTIIILRNDTSTAKPEPQLSTYQEAMYPSLYLVPPKHIPSINLLRYIIQTRVVPIRDNRITLGLERLKIIYYTAAEECGTVLKGGLVYYDLGALGLDALHYALD